MTALNDRDRLAALGFQPAEPVRWSTGIFVRGAVKPAIMRRGRSTDLVAQDENAHSGVMA